MSHHSSGTSEEYTLNSDQRYESDNDTDVLTFDPVNVSTSELKKLTCKIKTLQNSLKKSHDVITAQQSEIMSVKELNENLISIIQYYKKDQKKIDEFITDQKKIIATVIPTNDYDKITNESTQNLTKTVDQNLRAKKCIDDMKKFNDKK